MKTTAEATSGSAPTTSPLRGRAREEAILAAVVELVGELGYERVTVNAIATRARASKATMYAKWPGGKAELVAYALRRQARGGDLVVVADTGSVRGDLLAAVASIARAVTGTGGLSLLALVGALRDDPVLREQVRTQIRATSAETGRAICGRAAQRGELAADGDDGAALDTAVAHVLLATLLDGAPPDADAQRRLVDVVLLPALTARPGPPA